ncbi:MAG: protein TolR [Candidatus Latescibacteria bacterium]|nr:protein TolR [Candidatus Latescibacterota bacterium]NIO27244.1 protein TolR [Candidatus Latescibacterota bacterium]NIO54768.1 protein TolR [Candidatus Latescibacterota bacterium]NIT00851.1 protein TolR [Candidatus Latescibacterota bacterium]NIT37774.1 protein TolR [Candidatus Latescibacterota bacterium]
MKKSRYSSIHEINLTSLVDVVLVLLIIFMLTAPFIQAGIKVKLPKAKSTVIKETEGIVIAVTKEGEVYLDNELVEAEDLAEALRNLKLAGEERVFVRADEGVQYGVVMKVVGNVKGAGIDEVGLITEMKD